jgi:YVTN family beta-propeller protein
MTSNPNPGRSRLLRRVAAAALAAGAMATPVALASVASHPRVLTTNRVLLRTHHLRQAPALPGAQPISSRDRVYTADQASNTVSVIDPKTNRVLGTIPLGQDRLGTVLGPTDTSEVDVHGLGFSRDGSLLDTISIVSNAAQQIRTEDNKVVHTTYVGRSPHEGFVSPDGRTLWVAVRGQNYVSVISTRTGRELHRIYTADGPSKVVFSPDGRLAYVNHLRARVADVIRVADRRIIKTIHGTAPQSSDEAISPDGRELWLGHPFTGQTTVIDAKRMRVIAIMNTGPRTNHPQFITKPNGREYAYLTIGGLNETLVYRDHGGAPPTLVTAIKDHGYGPHGIWPSPDNTRIYVALQNSDALDVINTATNTVIKTLHIGQDPMALVYVANAVPHGSGRQGLTRQGLDQPVENLAVQTQGVPGTAALTVRQLADTDMLVFNAHGLPPHRTVTLSGVRSDGATIPLFSVQANALGHVDQALSYSNFIGIYDRAVLTYARPGALAIPAGEDPLCGT